MGQEAEAISHLLLLCLAGLEETRSELLAFGSELKAVCMIQPLPPNVRKPAHPMGPQPSLAQTHVAGLARLVTKPRWTSWPMELQAV